MGGTGKGETNYWGVHLHFEVKNRPVIENPTGAKNYPGPYWGYTPTKAENYGYVNPASVIGSWTAIPYSGPFTSK